jgi:hypothetical protein
MAVVAALPKKKFTFSLFTILFSNIKLLLCFAHVCHAAYKITLGTPFQIITTGTPLPKNYVWYHEFWAVHLPVGDEHLL